MTMRTLLSKCVEAALPEPRRRGAASNSLSVSRGISVQTKMEAAPVRLGSQRAASTHDWLRLRRTLICLFTLLLAVSLHAQEPARVQASFNPDSAEVGETVQFVIQIKG